MPVDPARVALAHQVLAQLGVSLADLHATSVTLRDGLAVGAVIPWDHTDSHRWVSSAVGSTS